MDAEAFPKSCQPRRADISVVAHVHAPVVRRRVEEPRAVAVARIGLRERRHDVGELALVDVADERDVEPSRSAVNQVTSTSTPCVLASPRLAKAARPMDVLKALVGDSRPGCRTRSSRGVAARFSTVTFVPSSMLRSSSGVSARPLGTPSGDHRIGLGAGLQNRGCGDQCPR